MKEKGRKRKNKNLKKIYLFLIIIIVFLAKFVFDSLLMGYFARDKYVIGGYYDSEIYVDDDYMFQEYTAYYKYHYKQKDVNKFYKMYNKLKEGDYFLIRDYNNMNTRVYYEKFHHYNVYYYDIKTHILYVFHTS